MNGAVGPEREGGADALGQRCTAFVVERRGVARRRTLPAQERRPVVVEISKDGWDVDCPNLHIAEPCSTKEFPERTRSAQRETTPPIQRERRRVERHRRVPEVSHELHR